MTLPCIFACLLMAGAATHAEVLFSDSFEGEYRGRWHSSWGPVERSAEFAEDGDWSIKETLEDQHGLSVWWRVFDAYPGATYRASAWVYVPDQDNAGAPALTLNRLNWSTLVGASTEQRDRWVRLEIEFTNTSERRIRLQLFQQGQKAGLGGSVMYWDSVVVEREIGEVVLEDGIRINPHVREGLDVTPAGGMNLRVAPGEIDVEGKAVTVAGEAILELQPPRVIRVRDEPARLTDEEPQGYGKGTPLRGCIGRGTSLAGSLDPRSLIIKAAKGPDGARFSEGVDWRADKAWGRVGRLPEGAIAADTTVFMDYDYSLMRIDTIEVRSDGMVCLRTGPEDKARPRPPEIDTHATALCNIFIPYYRREIAPEDIYPIGPPFPSPSEEELQRNAALIPNSVEKLEAGEELTLLFWGDSVTCGGDASSQATAFPQSFTAWLRNRYPQASIEYVNAGTGGLNSAVKLPLFQEEVIDRRPDLVIIEFVNDMGMDREMIFANYTEAVTRIREIGGEVIIILPHFTRPDWMGGGIMRTEETRAAIAYLKEFAEENRVGLADASRRWAHLWIEGIPYITLLRNAINHPDDRGHALFVEELQRFFP